MTIRINKKTQSALHERGISLLVVLLIGSIILVTALGISQYATRMTQALRARSDAIQTLYLAESTFECVRYWLNKDYRNFSDMVGGTVYCNGQPINNSSISYVSGIGTFTISTTPLSGTVKVEVEREDPSAQLFDGHVRVYSQSALGTGSKATERFQEYYYRVLWGADIIFLVDRSGSIEDGGVRTLRTLDTDWNKMLDAVNTSIQLLHLKVPSPQIGIVSFGTDAEDTGEKASPLNSVCIASGFSGCSDPNFNWREPDVPLTATSLGLDNFIDAGDFPKMRLGYSATNFSLGLAIAGAELMGKYYPHSGVGPLPAGVNSNAGSGAFERIVANNGDFGDLPNQTPKRDRDDDSYPDVIVVITDGAPNGIMTHVPNTWYESSVMGPPAFNYIDPQPSLYPLGRAKLMRTPTSGSGVLIVDNASVPAPSRYNYCHDSGEGSPVRRPINVFSSIPALANNKYPNYAMCNGSLIANKLKNDEKMNIITIFVGPDDPTLEEYIWLQQSIASLDVDGTPLFARVGNYDEVRDALLYLFERMEIIKSR